LLSTCRSTPGASSSGTSTSGTSTSGSGSTSSPAASPSGDLSKITTQADCENAGGTWQATDKKCAKKSK
jgi:hypothetical protein